MKQLFQGPASGVTLADGTSVLLWPGREPDLPEGAYTQTLQAERLLIDPAPARLFVSPAFVKPGFVE